MASPMYMSINNKTSGCVGSGCRDPVDCPRLLDYWGTAKPHALLDSRIGNWRRTVNQYRRPVAHDSPKEIMHLCGSRKNDLRTDGPLAERDVLPGIHATSGRVRQLTALGRQGPNVPQQPIRLARDDSKVP